jgi:hypothetical protein
LEPTAARPACEAAAHGGPGPMTGGNHPPTGGPGNHPPTAPGMATRAHSPVDISHCANLEPTAARPACEAAAHGGPGPMTGGNHPPTGP